VCGGLGGLQGMLTIDFGRCFQCAGLEWTLGMTLGGRMGDWLLRSGWGLEV
jgi:hypothetical protein